MIINFDVTIPKTNRNNYQKKIQNELSGVFKLILVGQGILEQNNFSKCEAIDNARSN
jgi:putative DNA primase/helicase